MPVFNLVAVRMEFLVDNFEVETICGFGNAVHKKKEH
jgi:hypothetical protein